VARAASRYLPGVDLRARLAAALAAGRALDPPPDLWVLGGDMMDDGPEPDYRSLGDLCAGLGAPVHLCLGNHDSLDAYARAPLPAAPPRSPGYYSLDIPGFHVVILFTAAERRGAGSLDAAQLEWLREDLASSAPARVLIFMHHPPVEVGVQWLDAIMLKEAGRFWRAADGFRQRICAVLFAHVHFAVSLSRQGVLLASPPAVGWQFRADPGSAKAETAVELPGFNVLDAGESGLTVRTVRFLPPSSIREGDGRGGGGA
jgi:3',5'-cyclic-AMP phosphodiesterase